MTFDVDRLVFRPDDVDLTRSPLAGKIAAETYVLGAFNPGLTRLSNGNLLMMIRVAEALRTPIEDGHIRAIRWCDDDFVLDRWPLDCVDTTDPRVFALRDHPARTIGLTSLSWLLPVEMSPDGLSVVDAHYDRAIAPHASFQCYGIEDARLSKVGDAWLMTTCSVSPERQGTSLYTSSNGLDWQFDDIVLDHQNKDMLIFEGLIGGRYYAQTRPLGDVYFAYPPDSKWRAGPSINLALSPDGRHWKPCRKPGLRARADAAAMAKMGGGAPPILTSRGWLSLWHGVEPNDSVGIYRTYWSLLDKHDPSIVTQTSHTPLIQADPALTEPLADQVYLRDIVFTTGIVDGGDQYIVASGEADLACRITHVPKSYFDVGQNG